MRRTTITFWMGLLCLAVILFCPASQAQTAGISQAYVRSAKAIGKVKAVNKGFGFVITSAGSTHVRKPGKIIIRRQGRLLVVAEIEDVTGETSTAVLVDYIPDGPKSNLPKVGDEVIPYRRR